MRERLIRRLWLAAVICAFCAPLFVGLGRTDMENDEAIYSYAVDRMLENGDWLNPVSSPHQNEVFLEKPPLKFWLVAAPMALGLVPTNEWGMRLWDAFFGAAAFIYVFLFGRRLAGPLAGVVAVLVLFAYGPLLFEHGLRNNNMEAPLVLSYCGGVYHFLMWAEAGTPRRRWLDAMLTALYIFLGFMTKFVAVFFLPLLLVAATILNRDVRTKVVRDWKMWVAAAAACIGLALPWFLYQQWSVGAHLWRVILGDHVVARMTVSIDAHHIQPWTYYFTEIYDELVHSRTDLLVFVGSALLIVDAVRKRAFELQLVVLWFVLPMAIISAGTSKLHHYVYPFLPPLALAAGYLIGRLGNVGASLLTTVQRYVAGLSSGNRLRHVLLAGAALAMTLAVATVIFGTVEWNIGDTRIFRNSNIARPLAVAMLLALIAGRGVMSPQNLWAVALLLIVAPVHIYEEAWQRTLLELHPLRTARSCLTRVQQEERAAGRPAPGVYAVSQVRWFQHSYFYYFRGLGWEEVREAKAEDLDIALLDPMQLRPVMIDDEGYLPFRARYRALNVPMLRFSTAMVLLPGPYGQCVPVRSR